MTAPGAIPVSKASVSSGAQAHSIKAPQTNEKILVIHAASNGKGGTSVSSSGGLIGSTVSGARIVIHVVKDPVASRL